MVDIKKLNKVILRIFISKFPPNLEYIVPRKFCFLMAILITGCFVDEQNKKI